MLLCVIMGEVCVSGHSSFCVSRVRGFFKHVELV